eukprot:gene24-biopygen95
MGGADEYYHEFAIMPVHRKHAILFGRILQMYICCRVLSGRQVCSDRQRRSNAQCVDLYSRGAPPFSRNPVPLSCIGPRQVCRAREGDALRGMYQVVGVRRPGQPQRPAPEFLRVGT